MKIRNCRLDTSTPFILGHIPIYSTSRTQLSAKETNHFISTQLLLSMAQSHTNQLVPAEAQIYAARVYYSISKLDRRLRYRACARQIFGIVSSRVAISKH